MWNSDEFGSVCGIDYHSQYWRRCSNFIFALVDPNEFLNVRLTDGFAFVKDYQQIDVEIVVQKVTDA